MATDLRAKLARILDEIERTGLILESDPRLPTVANFVAGEAVRGSWWGHPVGHEIHEITGILVRHPDICPLKFVSRKTTFLHRKLWPSLLALAEAREPWQLDGLSVAAEQLLQSLESEGELRCDSLPRPLSHVVAHPGEAARELERRLLAFGVQMHTDRGSHSKRLESWQHWSARVGCQPRGTAAEGRQRFELVVSRLNEEYGAAARLPWQYRVRAKGRGVHA